MLTTSAAFQPGFGHVMEKGTVSLRGEVTAPGPTAGRRRGPRVEALLALAGLRGAVWGKGALSWSADAGVYEGRIPAEGPWVAWGGDPGGALRGEGQRGSPSEGWPQHPAWVGVHPTPEASCSPLGALVSSSVKWG